MSDPSSQSASGGPSGRDSRPVGFVGRLSSGLRDQNWTAVVIEILVVVLGVVIGFQVNAWGHARSDRTKERGYLEQLTSDVAATRHGLHRLDSTEAAGDRASARLVAAFRAPQAPPADSLLAWVARATRVEPPYVVLGTVRTLLSTGDLALIRDGALRAYLPLYAEGVQSVQPFIDRNTEDIVVNARTLAEKVDYVDAFRAAAGESLGVAGLPTAGTSPFPLDPKAFLHDREAYAAAWGLFYRRRMLILNRSGLEASTDTLAAMLDAARERAGLGR
jgi:hypothetical protein